MGTGMSNGSSQHSQKEGKVMQEGNKTSIPVSPSAPLQAEESSKEEYRFDSAAQTQNHFNIVEDFTNTDRDPKNVTDMFQNNEISPYRMNNPIAVQL